MLEIGEVRQRGGAGYYLVVGESEGRATLRSLEDGLLYTEKTEIVLSGYVCREWDYLVTYTQHDDDSVNLEGGGHVSADFGVRLARTSAYGPSDAMHTVECFSNERGYSTITPIKAEAVL